MLTIALWCATLVLLVALIFGLSVLMLVAVAEDPLDDFDLFPAPAAARAERDQEGPHQ